MRGRSKLPVFVENAAEFLQQEIKGLQINRCNHIFGFRKYERNGRVG